MRWRPDHSTPDIATVVSAIEPIDASVAARARAELDRKTKPRKSLGRLEDLAVQLAAIRRSLDLMPLQAAVVVAAADHGYAAHGVSAYPQEVTRQMLANFAAGGAAVAVLARQAGARLVLVDAGVVGGPRSEIVSLDIARGTADATAGPAMPTLEMEAAIEAGAATAAKLAGEGVSVLALGDMGIGNTTAASALCAALLGVDAAAVCGPGTGLDADGVARKARVVEQALAVNAVNASDPLAALSGVGGLEIAFLTGTILGAARERQAVVLDGFIIGSCALVAARLAPRSVDYMVAAHLSPEPGHRLVLADLGLAPLLDLELRLGEGSGATLALPIVSAAAALLVEMATFESAGVHDSGR